ncbi:hypothetical protein E2C01_048293 [Portunus trituberculatus]|uniref:Uncharacterized protein n=1 Tax=Portunus trituberculatus TaxID=210409 RepID=A0A5B7GAS5_PORTR|nr:hypothetical protein [Portunus trituberculatus]
MFGGVACGLSISTFRLGVEVWTLAFMILCMFTEGKFSLVMLDGMMFGTAMLYVAPRLRQIRVGKARDVHVSLYQGDSGAGRVGVSPVPPGVDTHSPRNARHQHAIPLTISHFTSRHLNQLPPHQLNFLPFITTTTTTITATITPPPGHSTEQLR